MATKAKKAEARAEGSERQAELQLRGIKAMVAALDIESAKGDGEWRDIAYRFNLVPDGNKNYSEAHWLKSLKAAIAAGDILAESVRESAEEFIQQDPLSVQVRYGWIDPGKTAEMLKSGPEEFEILLCTGGPACRIIGKLDEHNEPESARIEHQDWGTPWTEYRLTSDDEEIVLTYCRQFYFGN